MQETSVPESVIASTILLLSETGGELSMPVSGASMWPTLRPNDHITVRRDLWQINDILLFFQNEQVIVHRLLSRQPDGFLITKGDNRRLSDAPILEEHVIGRVVHIERHGRVVPVYRLLGSVLRYGWLVSGLQRRLRTVLRS